MDVAALISSVPHWHQDYEIAPGMRTNGSYDPEIWMRWMELPQSLRGLRVLDIGSCDGYFSWQLARRGAEVVALDYRHKRATGFHVMELISGLPFEFHHANLFDIPGLPIGDFDIVLCLGVLYHLPDPYRSLAIISDICRGKLFLETIAMRITGLNEPLMRFHPRRSLNNDLTNFWCPNTECVHQLLADTGFAVSRSHSSGEGEIFRLIVEASRHQDAELEWRKRHAYALLE